MADHGIKVIKPNKQYPTTSVADVSFNSQLIQLKVHKQGSFSATYIQSSGCSATIQFNELGHRPLVLVYCQRKDHDGNIDTRYHLLEWAYAGATQNGYQRVRIYRNKFVFEYRDLDAAVDGTTFTIFGYYYVFKERVDQ